MSNDKLNELLMIINEPKFFDFLLHINIDDALDKRDGDEFEKQWLNSFNKIKNICFPDDCIEIINRIREASFKLSFKVCGDSDVSAYISDDFEMISKCLLLNDAECWPLSYLLNRYLKGEFPG